MPTCPEPKELPSQNGQLITWLLVFAGWVVVHWMSVRRARRQEKLAMLGAIEKRIVALRVAAVAYYTSQPAEADKASETHFKLEVKSIIRNIKLLGKKRHSDPYNVEGDIISLRQALTGGDFEVGVRKVFAPDDEKIQEIWGCADDLIASLQAAFERVHWLS
jgi:hypothetical protein